MRTEAKYLAYSVIVNSRHYRSCHEDGSTCYGARFVLLFLSLFEFGKNSEFGCSTGLALSANKSSVTACIFSYIISVSFDAGNQV